MNLNEEHTFDIEIMSDAEGLMALTGAEHICFTSQLQQPPEESEGYFLLTNLTTPASIVVKQTSNDIEGSIEAKQRQNEHICIPRLLHEILSLEPDGGRIDQSKEGTKDWKLSRIPSSSIISPQCDQTIVLSLQFIKYKSKMQWDSRPWSLEDIRGAYIHTCSSLLLSTWCTFVPSSIKDTKHLEAIAFRVR